MRRDLELGLQQSSRAWPVNTSLPPSCCLLILNYNGKEHLDDCLSSALVAAKRFPGTCPVVLADNRSTDDDVEYVRSRYPEVAVALTKKNDCLFSLNPIVAGRPEEIVLILNNDMRYERDFISPLVSHFEDPLVFAVTAKVLNWDGSEITSGKHTGRFGRFWFYKEKDPDQDRACLTLYAGAGCAAFRRSMFLELGGFDTLFRPGYWEDTDLSYRAWKRGWKVIYEPRSVIYHKVGATLNKMYGPSKVERLIRRNEVLFTIKNCGDIKFLLVYLCLLPWRIVRSLMRGNTALAYGICGAFTNIPLALSRRFEPGCGLKRSDISFLKAIAEEYP